MKKILILVLGSGSICYLLSGQIVNDKPLSQRITGYKMEVGLDTAAKTVSGTMDAYWVNVSTDKVPDIQMHMYLNAFSHNKTTLYRESGGSPGSGKLDPGWITIRSMTDRKGNDLTSSMKFISPDDGNAGDRTVLQVMLPEAVNPGDTVFLKVSFVSKLPSRIRRTGFADDYFFVAQWFPKFGVYEPAGMRYATKGGWNCHQFHVNSEFYSNFSVYDVRITLPQEYVVGTGGMLIDEKITDDGKKTITARAEDIVDFAWTAWPGYALFTDQWNHVKITLLLPEDRTEQVARQFKAVKNALEYLTKNVGPFPWPHLTFIDPPAKGGGATGMEYTTIFTSASSYGIPEFIHVPEMVTIHEFGHAYFMGMFASNEFEEPWLDEGVNSFLEERIMDHYYGPDGGMLDHPFLKIGDQTIGRMSYVGSGSKQVVSNGEYSWNYPHFTYGMMSYQKTATWMYTLMGIIGEEATNEVFREYYREWAFKHPSGKDFIAVVNKVVTRIHGNRFGTDMNWFFDQVTYGTGICDYKVSGLMNRKQTGFEGAEFNGDSVSVRANSAKDDTIYTATVQLERLGEIMLPVDVLVHFDNGETVTESWDGKSRFKDFSYTGTRKVNWVKIDPEYKIKMDVNYINNSMTMDPDRKPLRRMSNKLVTIMQFFINFISL